MIEILYEDDAYVVFNKPAGLLVIPSPSCGTKTMIQEVNRPKPSLEGLSGVLPSKKLYPCHRLDRDTSGVILFAKGKANQKKMMDEFRHQRVDKVYLAFVRGRLPAREGVISNPVPDRYHRRSVTDSGTDPAQMGKPALTKYRVLALRKDYTFVEVRPRTGRKNQIRIHFRQLGHPLLGERVYAFRKDFKVHFRRLALHAASLAWGPTGQRITVEAPLPGDMEDFLQGH